jgi:hypothetical protein
LVLVPLGSKPNCYWHNSKRSSRLSRFLRRSAPSNEITEDCHTLAESVHNFFQAISDLLLGVFCMPFTLVGQVLRNFIFGAAMCKLIPYFQGNIHCQHLQPIDAFSAVSVSVGVWTLVAISLERYFAICRPLKSRRWQTQFHAYKMIAVVWLASLFWSAPVLAVSSLKAMKGRGRLMRLAQR